MKTTITFEVDTDTLANFNDAHLAQLWHIGQANPAPHGDRDAGVFAEAVGREIIRRWLKETHVEMYTHQGGHHFWKALTSDLKARCKDGVWSIPEEGETP